VTLLKHGFDSLSTHRVVCADTGACHGGWFFLSKCEDVLNR
jgi:hypothetical protein